MDTQKNFFRLVTFIKERKEPIILQKKQWQLLANRLYNFLLQSQGKNNRIYNCYQATLLGILKKISDKREAKKKRFSIKFTMAECFSFMEFLQTDKIQGQPIEIAYPRMIYNNALEQLDKMQLYATI